MILMEIKTLKRKKKKKARNIRIFSALSHANKIILNNNFMIKFYQISRERITFKTEGMLQYMLIDISIIIYNQLSCKCIPLIKDTSRSTTDIVIVILKQEEKGEAQRDLGKNCKKNILKATGLDFV